MAAKKKATKGKARKRNGLVLRSITGGGDKPKYGYLLDGKPPVDFMGRTVWYSTIDARNAAASAARDAKYGKARKSNPKKKARRKNSAVPARAALMLKKAKEWEKQARAGGRRGSDAGAFGWSMGPAELRKRAAEFRAEAARLKAEARKSNPCKKKPAKRKRNGSEIESAAKIYKKFHGKQATKVKTVQQLRVTPSVLADCGLMVDVVVATDTGAGLRLPFKGTRLAVTGNGGQLYFVGGDQGVNLRQFPNVAADKDHVDLGEVVTICYRTSKDFHNFEKSDYEHEFGEEGGARPLLAYDVQSKRLYLVGGDYVVKREGIVN